jgi:hypothetical protein
MQAVVSFAGHSFYDDCEGCCRYDSRHSETCRGLGKVARQHLHRLVDLGVIGRGGQERRCFLSPSERRSERTHRTDQRLRVAVRVCVHCYGTTSINKQRGRVNLQTPAANLRERTVLASLAFFRR